MIEESETSENFTQIHGDTNALITIPNEIFDMIVCHLVLEFVEDPKLILDGLTRVLKKDDIVSVVRHNKN